MVAKDEDGSLTVSDGDDEVVIDIGTGATIKSSKARRDGSGKDSADFGLKLRLASVKGAGRAKVSTDSVPSEADRAHQLKAEKAKLLRRLKEIEAEEAKIEASEPAPGEPKVKATSTRPPVLGSIPYLKRFFSTSARPAAN